MIGRLIEAPDDLGLTAGIHGGIENDLLKKGRFDVSGAGEGKENTARLEQFERKKVDVLVSAGGLFHLPCGLSKLRGVEDHHIEFSGSVPVRSQELKYVSLDVFGRFRIPPVDFHILLEKIQRSP